MQIYTEISAIQERLRKLQTLLYLWKMQKYQTEQSRSQVLPVLQSNDNYN